VSWRQSADMLRSLLPDLATRSVKTVSMRLSDGSVFVNSQKSPEEAVAELDFS
jgi:hypothetical protein